MIILTIWENKIDGNQTTNQRTTHWNRLRQRSGHESTYLKLILNHRSRSKSSSLQDRAGASDRSDRCTLGRRQWKWKHMKTPWKLQSASANCHWHGNYTHDYRCQARIHEPQTVEDMESTAIPDGAENKTHIDRSREPNKKERQVLKVKNHSYNLLVYQLINYTLLLYACIRNWVVW